MKTISALLCAVASTSVGAELIRGPYLQLATPDSIVVVWRTNAEIDPAVRIGRAPDETTRVPEQTDVVRRVSVDVAAASNVRFGSTPLLYDEPAWRAAHRAAEDPDPSTPRGTRQYEVTLRGLSAGTRYYYAVYDGSELLAGGDDEHFFRTTQCAGEPTELRLWVVGDSGTGGVEQQQVYDAMRAHTRREGQHCDAILHLGDMAYRNGADVEFQQNFFEVYHETLRSTVCWPTMGNHEGGTASALSEFGPYYDAYVLPRDAEAGGEPSGTEAYYSFDIGGVHFICLDSFDLDRSTNGAMVQWMERDLESTQAEWLIAYWHHPPYTKGSYDSDEALDLTEIRSTFLPLLESHGIDLVLAGHSHIYERSNLVDGAYTTPTTAEGVVLDAGDGRLDGDGPYRKRSGLRPNEGTVIIVAGHGGVELGRNGTMPIMERTIVDHGSLLIDINGDTLTGAMIDKHARVRDEFAITKHSASNAHPERRPEGTTKSP